MSPKSILLTALFTRRAALSTSLAAVFALPAGAGQPSADQPTDGQPIDGRAFRRAAEAGDLETLRGFLARDRSLAWSRDESGRSVAVLALLAGHPEVLPLLREHGLEPDLVESTMAADWERVRQLLEPAPEQVGLLHPFGGNALHAGALLGHGERLFELQIYGGDANAIPPGGCGQTPLRLAFEGRDPKKAEATVAALLGNGADPNAPQKHGDLPLHAAARAKNAYLVRLLLRKGASPAPRNERGETPLEIAEAAGDGTAAALLRDPHKVRRDYRGTRFTPGPSGRAYAPPAIELPRLRINRMVAAAHGDFDKVRAEVASHPELAFAVSSQDELTVEASAHVGRRDLVRYFLDLGLPQSLLTALAAGDLGAARRILAADPRAIDERGPHDLPITFYPSFAGGDLEAAALLAAHGVDLGAEKMGVTALHVAANMGQAELAELWLAHGADPGARTRDERAATPLDFARQQGHARLAELLASRS